MVEIVHRPVMVDEVLKIASFKTDNFFVVDCTTGEGGHTEAILKNLQPEKVIALDIDNEILTIAKERLKEYPNVIFINENYKNLGTVLDLLNIPKVDFILFDLGASLFHFKSNRGFSFNSTERLDMRYNLTDREDAYYVINNCTQKELEFIFSRYGEERFSKRIAKNIINVRKTQPIQTPIELANIIKKSIRRRYKIHPATKVFQAIRIKVNKEIDNLEASLPVAFQRLNSGGRVAFLTYHSLEDRVIKQFFKQLEKAGSVKFLTKKPIRPEKAEIKANIKARSAKLRAFEKIKTD